MGSNMVDRTFDPSTQVAEAGRPIWIWGQPGLRSKFQACHAYMCDALKNKNGNGPRCGIKIKIALKPLGEGLSYDSRTHNQKSTSALNNNHKRSSLWLFPQLGDYL